MAVCVLNCTKRDCAVFHVGTGGIYLRKKQGHRIQIKKTKHLSLQRNFFLILWHIHIVKLGHYNYPFGGGFVKHRHLNSAELFIFILYSRSWFGVLMVKWSSGSILHHLKIIWPNSKSCFQYILWPPAVAFIQWGNPVVARTETTAHMRFNLWVTLNVICCSAHASSDLDRLGH